MTLGDQKGLPKDESALLEQVQALLQQQQQQAVAAQQIQVCTAFCASSLGYASKAY